MKKINKTIVAFSLMILFVIILVTFFFYPFLPHPFKTACNKIQVGMSREEILNVMKNYINKKGYDFNQDNTSISWYTIKLFDDWECGAFLKDDKAIKIWHTFD